MPCPPSCRLICFDRISEEELYNLTIMSRTRTIFLHSGNILFYLYSRSVNQERTKQIYPSTFIKSRRGKMLISVGGFRFYAHRTINNKTRWLCSTHLNKGSTIVRSRKGKSLLSLGGYTYCTQRKTGIKTDWACSTHKNKGCRARVVTYDDEIIKMNNNHSH
ncbi:hypothetical protein K1T71_006547 [Dendrolimus kikuchii]|uniref:Uncharacterized protein n=1 Tax=Dendrolimus kikuchii TaxID=765133 RepID=A0ACC1D124_9NEOP|nr:hypothetical protein K1T71_006547 [Dendrolimus kikuchii]